MLDGFDLGIGILFSFLKRHENRETAMNTIAPFWDGNETWLMLGDGGLPFLSALTIFVLSFVGIGISFYPNILPPELKI